MKIHTVKSGEKIAEIAKEYGVDEEILRMNNQIPDGECAEGEELLVLVPTRTYRIQRGDSAERLALRFGVRRRELAAMNPWIECEGLTPGKMLAIRYDERKYGMASSGGYLYSGGSPEMLKMRLPYLTYLTVAATVLEYGKIRRLFDFRDTVGLVRSMDKIPMLKLHIKDDSLEGSPELVREIISYAAASGFKGITLGGKALTEEGMLEVKKQMIGSDLILFCELDNNSPKYLTEYCDGGIFSVCDGTDTDEGVQCMKFASEGDSSRCMLELCSFAASDKGYIPVGEAIMAARRGGCKITDVDGECKFLHKRLGEVSYPSLKKIKATLEAIHEYGFMGASVDVMRTPLCYLMLYNSYFGASPYSCM